jgi:hypothetical protein
MSSKEQFKDALKREKQIIIDLKKELTEKDNIIRNLRSELFDYRMKNIKSITVEEKKWWQFWKK